MNSIIKNQMLHFVLHSFIFTAENSSTKVYLSVLLYFFFAPSFHFASRSRDHSSHDGINGIYIYPVTKVILTPIECGRHQIRRKERIHYIFYVISFLLHRITSFLYSSCSFPLVSHAISSSQPGAENINLLADDESVLEKKRTD